MMPSIHVYNWKLFFKVDNSFWAPALKSPAENSILKKSLDASLITFLINMLEQGNFGHMATSTI